MIKYESIDFCINIGKKENKMVQDNKYEEILNQLAEGKLEEYKVEAKNAFAFQAALRNYGKRQDITGVAQRGGAIVYKPVKNEN